MIIITEQILLLFIFMLIGYTLGKTGLIDRKESRVLSTLLVYLFFPCTIFKAFYTNFNIANLSVYYPLTLSGIVILGIIIVFASIMSKYLGKDEYEKKIYKYTLIIANFGYMGYAVAEGLFGTDGLLNMILFAMPFSCFTYTAGYCMLTKRELSLKRLINPVMIAIFLGAVFGLTGIKIPKLAKTAVLKSSSCMAPISMLLAGITISEYKIKELITDKNVYIACAFRLIIIPVTLLLVLRQFAPENIVRSAVLLTAMPCGLNTIIFPRLIGENCKTGAKLAFVSNILALATIPLIINAI
ncbi:MAG: AEC family transporter [Eubacteriales bacterium]|nr:AEC family transporter [Eubacteriales bacterium]